MTVVLGLSLSGCGGSGGEVESPARIALSGIIEIEAGTRVDADNADALISRSRLTGAQRLPAEFILAGYVSDTQQPGDYSPGSSRFQYFPDTVDEFVSPLKSGLELTLQSFATSLGTASDLQIIVESPGGSVVANETAPADGTPISFSLTSEQEGDYTITVTALDTPPMLYSLTSSRPETSGTTAYDWPEHEFVQDEAIVSLSQSGKAGALTTALSSSALMVPGRQIAPGLWTVRRPNVAAMGSNLFPEQTLEWIRRLRQDPGVQHASPNYKVQALSPVSEPLYTSNNLGQQWHYSLINGPTAWQLAPGGGAGVKVAVMDTGLFGQPGDWHGDLNVNVSNDLTDTDFVSSEFDNDSGPSGPDSNPSDPGNTVGSSVFHGTHVAGTVSAVVNSRGGGGVAFGSTLLPVRVLGEGGTGSSADLLAALQWILGPAGGGPRADVVNLSLGGLPFIQSLQDVINLGSDKGIIYVAAAGNSATDVPSYPAAFNNVLSVSAVDGAGALASYSNFGNWIDLAAPGGDAGRDGNGDGQGDLVSSTSAAVVDGQLQAVYRGLQGTSMAAPHVSGVIALMKEARATEGSGEMLDFDQVRGYLISGDLTQASCDGGCSRTNQLGYGVLDAAKAVQKVLSGEATELLTSSAAVVNLATESDLAVSQSLELAPLGDYTITIDSLEASDPWFSVDPATGPSPATKTSPVQLELTLNPESLEAGASSRGTLLVGYTTQSGMSKTLNIPVIGQRITDQQARDAGRHFVLLVEPEPDPVSNEFITVGQAVATVDQGRYQFEFVPDDGQEPQFLNEIPPGDYILVAGTDLDNDGLICHSGEACAEYPVSGLRQTISVQENQPVTGLTMTTSYSRPTLSASSPDLLPRPGFKGYKLMSEQDGRPANNLKAIPNP
ncbi:S8 family serine peptidase [Marinobacter halotolerans]|uniref:S8 family serine peptidase n=1 Tax=Marinobacter halotolerans TaxID=1569211 RepID=UPI00177F97CC|nr:S8 family serine peptidase [Marinobacter halotolerans]